jgi:hypothetical protein
MLAWSNTLSLTNKHTSLLQVCTLQIRNGFIAQAMVAQWWYTYGSAVVLNPKVDGSNLATSTGMLQLILISKINPL